VAVRFIVEFDDRAETEDVVDSERKCVESVEVRGCAWEGLKGGGSFRGMVFVVVVLLLAVFDLCGRFVEVEFDIQSGCDVGVKGLERRSGFSIRSVFGGWILERAGRPLSSHHFRRSELAGGRPGSIES